MAPRLEPVEVTEARQLPPGQDEGVLERVLGHARVAQDAEGDRVELVAHLVDQDRERLTVAVPRHVDQVPVHGAL